MDFTPNNAPIRSLINDFIADRYEGVTFSEDFVASIEEKVAPIIKQQTEETVVEFVADFFSAKKPTRKPRRAKKKVEETAIEDESTPKTEEAENENTSTDQPL